MDIRLSLETVRLVSAPLGKLFKHICAKNILSFQMSPICKVFQTLLPVFIAGNGLDSTDIAAGL